MTPCSGNSNTGQLSYRNKNTTASNS